MVHSHTPSISKIKFLLRSARLWSLFLGWPFSPHPSFSVKCEAMPNYTTIHQTNLSPFTTSYSSHYLSSLQISSSTGYTGACIIQRFTRLSINRIINGSSQPLLRATHSIHWTGLRKACHITCIPISSLFKSLLILRFSSSSTYGPSLFVSPVLSLARVIPPKLNLSFVDDGEYVAKSPIINGAACHTMHHLYFNYNYGQFTTLWDRLGGSYRQPNDELFQRESKMSNAEWDRQCQEIKSTLKNVEGFDDRTYVADEATLHKKISWMKYDERVGKFGLCVFFSKFSSPTGWSRWAVNSIGELLGQRRCLVDWWAFK